MKNKITRKNSIFTKVSGALKVFGSDVRSILQENDFILRGVFWGISVAALVIGIVNIRQNSQLKEYEGVLELADEKVPEAGDLSQKIKNSLVSDLEEYTSNYVDEYFKTGRATEYFDEVTKKLYQEEIEAQLLKKIQETNSLNATQVAEIQELISEKISQIDYSKIEEQIQKAVESSKNSTDSRISQLKDEVLNIVGVRAEENVTNLSRDINHNFTFLTSKLDESCEALDEKLNDNYSSLDSKLTDNYSSLDNKMSENYQAIDTKMDESISMVNSQMEDNYEALLEKINRTDSRLMDSDSNEYFQYAIDPASGAVGYLYDGQWKPF